MQQEAFGHHLNDLAGLGSRQRGLEHRLMQLRVERSPMAGEIGDAMLGHHVGQLAQGQFDPFDQRGRLGALFVGRHISARLQVVVDRQQVARQAGAAILLGLAPVALGTLARVLGLGQRAHERSRKSSRSARSLQLIRSAVSNLPLHLRQAGDPAPSCSSSMSSALAAVGKQRPTSCAV
jgi:hypothetical protein